jgi:hypothetical protein
MRAPFRSSGAVTAAAALLLPLLAATGCGSSGGSEPNLTLGPSLTPRQLWQGRGLTAYRYTLGVQYRASDGAVRPVTATVEVRDGVATVTGGNQSALGGVADLSRYDTIPKLLELAEAIRLPNASELGRWNVRPNKTYGYPESVSFEYLTPRAGDLVGFSVADFAPL